MSRNPHQFTIDANSPGLALGKTHPRADLDTSRSENLQNGAKAKMVRWVNSTTMMQNTISMDLITYLDEILPTIAVGCAIMDVLLVRWGVDL